MALRIYVMDMPHKIAGFVVSTRRTAVFLRREIWGLMSQGGSTFGFATAMTGWLVELWASWLKRSALFSFNGRLSNRAS